jgi:Polyphosphate kinase 2 (PPK2)
MGFCTEEERPFEKRYSDRKRRWKLSPMDAKSRELWVAYSRAKAEMFRSERGGPRAAAFVMAPLTPLTRARAIGARAPFVPAGAVRRDDQGAQTTYAWTFADRPLASSAWACQPVGVPVAGSG